MFEEKGYTDYDKTTKLWTCTAQKKRKGQGPIIGQKILNALITNGPKLAQINDDTGVRMTFHDVWLETVRAAQNLQKRGYKTRQTFGFMAANSDHLAPIVLASLCLACPVAPVHPLLSKQELVRILAKTKPAVIFCDADVYNQMNEALEELSFKIKVFTFCGKIDGLEPVENLLVETGDERNFVPFSYDLDNDVAAMFCTSGSTGPSKSVCLSYDTDLLAPSIHPPGSILLTFESIYSTAGIYPLVSSMQSAHGVARVITSNSFSPDLQLKLIEKYQVTYLGNTPLYLVACLKHDSIQQRDLSSVRDITLYGYKIPSTLIVEAAQYFPNAKITSLYAMSEIGPITHIILNANSTPNCGLICPGTTVKIIDDGGNRCGPNITGEICVKKDHEFLGYLDDPEATSATVDSEGFFRTGDSGHFDENATLFFDERIKNVLRSYYFRGVVIPTEIEDFLLKMSDILEACVVGIPAGVGSNLLAAVIVKRPDSKLTQHDIYTAVADNFPIRSRLRGGLYFVNSFQKTLTGKPLRKEITELAVKMFRLRKDSDPDIQSYLSDIPYEYRKFIV